MDYQNSPYFHVSRASDLTGKDRLVYRLYEIIPGFLSWGTLIFIILMSAYSPRSAAYFIIAFNLYWLLKTVYLSIHLRHNWRRIQYNISLDWRDMLKNIKHDHLLHMVILPYYNESAEIVERSVRTLLDAHTDPKKIIVVLAAEERAGKKALLIGESVIEKYGTYFAHTILTCHPDGMRGEIAGKGSNISYAAEHARIRILDKHNIKYQDVVVSAFDIDTVVYPDYFNCLTWHFFTTPDPLSVSFQPVPVYNNNIWEAPALSRVVAISGTFWQMIQQERPEKLATFSSHAVSFQTLHRIGYWQRNVVSEDSRIFWNLFVASNGHHSVVPLSYPVSMDANVASTFTQTVKNIYKQHRRWGWGVENVPYLLFSFQKNRAIPRLKAFRLAFAQTEGFWSLATNPLIIFLLGWLPLALGGHEFNTTILSYNLPIVASSLMLLAMVGLVFSSIISLTLLPKMPVGFKKRHRVYMVTQWLLVPFTMSIFSAIPGLDAQTRLLLGKYMGFWVTPKHYRNKN